MHVTGPLSRCTVDNGDKREKQGPSTAQSISGEICAIIVGGRMEAALDLDSIMM